MSLTKRVGLVAGAAALTLTGASFAGTETTDQDLRARVAQMEAELAKLKAQEGSNWLTEQRATEIRALVQDVLADADTRTSLLQGGTAGWDNNFFLASGDGKFRLNIGGQLQFRWMYSNQDEDSAEDTSRGGFENTRTKLVFWGHVVDPAWTYKVEGDFNSRNGGDGAFTLEDAWINYNYDNGWGVKVGQFRSPGLREELVHSSMQLAVERSVLNSAFTAGMTQGIMLHYTGDNFRMALSYNDGARSANGPALAYDTEWSFSGRAEVLFAGTWDQFKDFTSWKGEEFGFLLGGAFHYQSAEYGTAATNELEVLGLTLDASLEFGGANLYAAVIWTDLDNDNGIDNNPWGFLVQGGIFLTDDVELFGRFEWGDSDDLTSEDLMIATIGFNKYFSKHQVKWTTDFGYAFEPVEAAWLANSDGREGWRADGADEDGQFVIRTQLQLLF